MEFLISDLLDDLQEVDVDILPYAKASENRIKELTMKKIQGTYERTPRRHPIGKILLIAAVVAVLAIPVMAVSGLLFTDWQEGIITPQDNGSYDEDLLLGGASKIWDTSGWAVRISTENATGEGLTFVCEELGDPEKAGTLTTTDGYWLERWDGSTYIPMNAAYESNTKITIVGSETARWDINWTDICGTLETGSYRIGKHFTYTNPDGNTEELDYYAKFRIFSQDMDTYLKQYQTAMDGLLNQESYHILETVYPDRQEGYAYYTTEIWKYGNDFLRETRYVKEDGSLWGRRGALYLNGKGYSLEWVGEDVLSGVADWESADYLDLSYTSDWHFSMGIIESILGQVYVDGNTLYFYEYSDWRDETYMSPEEIAEMNAEYPSWNHDYRERAYTLDETGKLIRIQTNSLLSLDPETADPIMDDSLEVFDTPADEIAKIIAAQNVSGVRAFSWEDDFAEYADTADTDGFVNTSKAPISTPDDAIARAKREADPKDNPKYRTDYDYNIATAWFDETAGMWKVQIGHSQDNLFVCLVYLDTDGITRMLVYPFADPLLLGSFNWEQTLQYDGDNPHAILEGFHNTDASPVATPREVLDRALEEVRATVPEGEFDRQGVYYDPVNQMWQATFQSSKHIYGYTLVFMDANGITQMIIHESP